MRGGNGLIALCRVAAVGFALTACDGGIQRPVVMVLHHPMGGAHIYPNLYTETQGLLTLSQGYALPIALVAMVPELRQVHVKILRSAVVASCDQLPLTRGGPGDADVTTLMDTSFYSYRLDAKHQPMTDAEGHRLFLDVMAVPADGQPLILDLAETGIGGGPVPYVKLFVTAYDGKSQAFGVSACYKGQPDTAVVAGGGPH